MKIQVYGHLLPLVVATPIDLLFMEHSYGMLSLQIRRMEMLSVAKTSSV
ncbi:hypothetical protein IJG79_00950 [Candidatus Saccharibacteria bacterium]|nr:hypothetical protein [Candidatus Saccharibacteria bacterium]